MKKHFILFKGKLKEIKKHKLNCRIFFSKEWEITMKLNKLCKNFGSRNSN